MNRKSTKQRAQILQCLVEGLSIRSTVRITGAAKNTIIKLLVDVGTACLEYQNKVLRNLACKRIECDEIWSFCRSKEKNVKPENKGKPGYGDTWTWTAIDPKSKLIPSFWVGPRDDETAKAFIADLAGRLKNKVQLTTDGHKVYIEAVEKVFGSEVDYGMVVKLYGFRTEEIKPYKYSHCIGTEKKKITGKPDIGKVSTSYVERQNLTMRMSMRRFTRRTNGFSKKIKNHYCHLGLYFMHYNFVRIHSESRVSPAMEAGVTDHLWSLKEVAGLAG